MERDNSSYVKIFVINGKVNVDSTVTVFYKNNSDRLICRVPSFNWSFDAINEEDLQITVNALITSFLNHYLKFKPSKRKIPAIATELYKLGFRPSGSHYDMQALINNNFRDTEFQSSLIDRPSDFSSVSEVANSLELDLA